ncbi:arylamine N-acetyltransferase [Allokutzneria multivorans]|uniref:Arylamine N-acetyltransferase n=1 Tax=Allokutzneria multivorans TaxID=1142134 RepID=A0ABP7QRC6_9PSEU
MTSYLAKLGLTPEPPSVQGLHRLHAAHVERVSYEIFEDQIGLPTSAEPDDVEKRIVHHRRGGNCYQLNLIFAKLLASLGYSVQLHRSDVRYTEDDLSPLRCTHVCLTVGPFPEDPDTRWLADVGLGDGLHQPLPLRVGDHRQGPFAYRLAPSPVVDGGWRFFHDPRGSVFSVDISPETSPAAEFVELHRARANLRPISAALRRHANGSDTLRALTLTRWMGEECETSRLSSRAEWFDALDGIFDVGLDDLSEHDRDRLWASLNSQQEQLDRFSWR